MNGTVCAVATFLCALPMTFAAGPPLRFDFSPSAGSRATGHAEGRIATVTAPRCPAAPRIDGSLRDTAWHRAVVIHVPSSATRTRGVPRTQARLCFDAHALYVGIECEQPGGTTPHAETRPRDDSGTWKDDCVEVWLDTSEAGVAVYQFIVNAAGSVFDVGRSKTSYNPEWQHAAAQEQDRWTVEIAIPKTALQLSAWPSRLGFDLGRTGPTLPHRSWTGKYGDTSQGALRFEGVKRAASDRGAGRGVRGSSGLTLVFDRPFARPPGSPIRGTLRLSLPGEATAAVRLSATLRDIDTGNRVAKISTVPARDEGAVLVDLQSAGLDAARLRVEVHSGSRSLGADEVVLFARETKSETGKPDELMVTGIKRLTPPVYRASNMFFAIRDAWSRDLKRMMLYEAQAFKDPESGKRGRGLVWGHVDDLKRWRTLEDYEKAAHPIYTKRIANREWPGNSTYWSPFPGEEDILYHIYRPTRSVSRYNVDTKERTDIMSYDPGDGTDVSKARSLGWTADNRFNVNFDDESRNSGGHMIDVIGKKRFRYEKQPPRYSQGGRRWPQRGHGHGHMSPDRSMSYASDRVLTDMLTGKAIAKLPKPHPKRGITHISWRASNKWFLGNDYGIYRHPTPTRPTLDPYGIWQVWLDGTAKLLLTQETAAHWQPKGKPRVVNWTAHFIATLRKDGRQVIWTSTDGKYTYQDHQEAGVANWGTEGLFLADLAPVVP